MDFFRALFSPFTAWYRMLKNDIKGGEWVLVGLDILVLFGILLATSVVSVLLFFLVFTPAGLVISAILGTVIAVCYRLAKAQEEDKKRKGLRGVGTILR